MQKQWCYKDEKWWNRNFLTDSEMEHLHDESKTLEERISLEHTAFTELSGDDLIEAQRIYDLYKPEDEPHELVWVDMTFYDDTLKSGIINYYKYSGARMTQKRFPNEIIY